MAVTVAVTGAVPRVCLAIGQFSYQQTDLEEGSGVLLPTPHPPHLRLRRVCWPAEIASS